MSSVHVRIKERLQKVGIQTSILKKKKKKERERRIRKDREREAKSCLSSWISQPFSLFSLIHIFPYIGPLFITP